jgi:hypothetical protein
VTSLLVGKVLINFLVERGVPTFLDVYAGYTVIMKLKMKLLHRELVDVDFSVVLCGSGWVGIQTVCEKLGCSRTLVSAECQ